MTDSSAPLPSLPTTLPPGMALTHDGLVHFKDSELQASWDRAVALADEEHPYLDVKFHGGIGLDGKPRGDAQIVGVKRFGRGFKLEGLFGVEWERGAKPQAEAGFELSWSGK